MSLDLHLIFFWTFRRIYGASSQASNSPPWSSGDSFQVSCLDGFAADLLAGGFPCSFEFDVKKNPSPFEVLVVSYLFAPIWRFWRSCVDPAVEPVVCWDSSPFCGRPVSVSLEDVLGSFSCCAAWMHVRCGKPRWAFNVFRHSRIWGMDW